MSPRDAAKVIAFPNAPSRAADADWSLPARQNGLIADYLARLSDLPVSDLFAAIQRYQTALIQPLELAFLVNNADWQRARRVLEIGPGEEAGTGSIADYFPEKEFHSVDIVVAARHNERGHRRYSVNIAQIGSAEAPLPDGQFDAVLLRWATQCIPSFDAFYERMSGRLTDGGSIFIAEPVDQARKFSVPMPLLDELFEKLIFFQNALGGNRNATRELAERLTIPGLAVVSDELVPAAAFDSADKGLLASLLMMIAEYMCRMMGVAIDRPALLRELMSWQLRDDAWGQLVVHYLQLHRGTR